MSSYSRPLERGPKGAFTRHSADPHTIVVHYTWATTSSMADVVSWHNARGFNGTGYHVLVRKDGSLEYGRPLWARGAHVRGYNDRTLGIAFEGGRIPGDNQNGHDTRTPAQKVAMMRAIRDWKERYPTINKVVGHRDLVATQCPGFDAAAWWAGTKSKPAPKGVPAITDDPNRSTEPGDVRGVKAFVAWLLSAIRGK